MRGSRDSELQAIDGEAAKPATLGPIYTLAEAAERLRTSRHAVAKTARRYGLCAVVGRDLRFTEADLVAIFDAMRPEARDTRVEHVAPRMSEADLSRRAEALLAKYKTKPRKPRETA